VALGGFVPLACSGGTTKAPGTTKPSGPPRTGELARGTAPTADPAPPSGPTEPKSITKTALTPSCRDGGGEVQCFARGSTHFNAGNVPSPGPSPQAHFDSNDCQLLGEVRDGCCNPAQSGPALIDGQCCYGFCTGTCCGRPLLVAGVPRIARAIHGAGWSEPLELELAQLDTGERELLARQWLDDALLEHASIASFARFALDLLAFGAPVELVERCQRAMGDEIEHARACFALASAYADQQLGPGPLDLSGVAPSESLAVAAAAAAREGCVNETIAALTAGEQARAARDPLVRSVLSRIAQDEAEHAELAWRFVDWAIRVGGEPVSTAVASALRPAKFAPVTTPRASSLRAYGHLTATEREAIAQASWNEVVLPCARRLAAAAI
jgi:hypothetical protein